MQQNRLICINRSAFILGALVPTSNSHALEVVQAKKARVKFFDGLVYFLNVEDTPPGKVYQRPQRHGAMPVTSLGSFWAMMALDLGMLLSLGLLTFPLTQPQIRFLQGWQELVCWGLLAITSE